MKHWTKLRCKVTLPNVLQSELRSDTLGCITMPLSTPRKRGLRLFTSILTALGMLVAALPAEARIARLVVEHTDRLGSDGYEKLTGHAYGELDPNLPLNSIITD